MGVLYIVCAYLGGEELREGEREMSREVDEE